MKAILRFCMVLALAGCEKAKTTAPAEVSAKKSHPMVEEGTAAVPPPGDEKTEEAGTNERNRALPRPPDKKHPLPEQAEHPFAAAVKDKPGYVVSPFNGKIIDVRDIPSGTLVQDPGAPAGTKSYFRVP